MFTLHLRLMPPLTIVALLLVVLMQTAGRLLPLAQIIPVAPYNSNTILLVDVERHLAAARHTNTGIINNAVVSPDQQQIVFSMIDNRQIHIYISGLYGNDYQLLTTDLLGADNPSWSPDNRQIAFVGFEPENKRGIYIVAANGKASLHTIVKAGNYGSPTWSPDGHYLTFTSSFFQDLPDIFVVDTACTLRCDREVIQITNALVADTAPIWSPDGSTIAFLSNRSGSYQIYTLNMSCMQPGERKCMLQAPKRINIRQLESPVFMLWSLDSHALYFRAWDSINGQPGLYAVEKGCATLPEGCQLRLVYNLNAVFHGRRG